MSWVQTLDTIALLARVSVPEFCEGSMPIADGMLRVEGLMCPAVVELVCEALQSSGRVPERLMACRTLRLRSHWAACAASGPPFSQDMAVPGVGFPRSSLPPLPKWERSFKILLRSLTKGNGVVEGFDVNAASALHRGGVC